MSAHGRWRRQPALSAALYDPGWDSHEVTRGAQGPTWRMTRGDWEWYHRGMPKRLRRAVLVS